MLFPSLQKIAGVLVVVILTLSINNISTSHKCITPAGQVMEKTMAANTKTALARQVIIKESVSRDMINKAKKAIVEMREDENMGNKIKRSSANIGEWGVGEGLLLMPDLKIAICNIPKVASKTWKFIALRILGNDPKYFCSCKNKVSGCNGAAISWHPISDHLPPKVRKMYKNTKWAKHEDPEELAKIMSPYSDWVTITSIRNPWKRFISAFWQDNGSRPHNYHLQGRINATDFMHGNKSCELQKLFEKYLSEPRKPPRNDTPHSRLMTKYCGLSHFEYDHVLDLDDKFHGLESILAPYNDLMTSGWESCMVNGRKSFYDDKIASPHHSSGTSAFWSDQICTADFFTRFRSKYNDDIELYNKYFPEREVNCVVKKDTCSDV